MKAAVATSDIMEGHGYQKSKMEPASTRLVGGLNRELLMYISIFLLFSEIIIQFSKLVLGLFASSA